MRRFVCLLAFITLLGCNSQQNEQQKASQKTDIVYVTKTGQKYHRGGCRYLSRSKISMERSRAISRGFEPCSVCRP